MYVCFFLVLLSNRAEFCSVYFIHFIQLKNEF